MDLSEYIGLKSFAPYRGTKEDKIRYKERHHSGGMIKPHNLNGSVKLHEPWKNCGERIRILFSIRKHTGLPREKTVSPVDDARSGTCRMRIDEAIQEALWDMKPRAVKRIEWMIWQAITTGQINEIDEDGDPQNATYTVPPGNLNLNPREHGQTSPGDTVGDILDIQNVKFIGTGFKLGAVIANSNTWKAFCNAKDTLTKYKAMMLGQMLTPGRSKH